MGARFVMFQHLCYQQVVLYLDYDGFIYFVYIKIKYIVWSYSVHQFVMCGGQCLSLYLHVCSVELEACQTHFNVYVLTFCI